MTIMDFPSNREAKGISIGRSEGISIGRNGDISIEKAQAAGKFQAEIAALKGSLSIYNHHFTSQGYDAFL